MHELLTYIYSGRSPNLTNMALDLLAAADRFQLTGLKEMADQVCNSAVSFFGGCAAAFFDRNCFLCGFQIFFIEKRKKLYWRSYWVIFLWCLFFG